MRRTICLALLLLPAALTAQRSAPSAAGPADFKDPGTATVLSVIIPGGGELYAGDNKTGGILLGTSSAGLLLAAASTSNGGTLLGLGAYLGSWVYGIVDASGAAERHNAALAHAYRPATSLWIAQGPSRTVHLGIRLTIPHT